MTETSNNCPKCSRKIMQSISNRCMYCGANLPEEHHLSEKEKAELLAAKLERFKENEENADQVISKMRQDFAIPEPKKSRKQRKKENADAINAAIAGINTQNNEGNGDPNN